MTTPSFNVGGHTANVNAQQLNFSDGTVQDTAYTLQRAPLWGVAVVTGTSAAVTFTTPYVGAQPVVLLTPYTQAPSFWVTFQGTVGNYTGFTVNVASTFFGAFNYVVFGNPN
jgi:hypothetical protein